MSTIDDNRNGSVNVGTYGEIISENAVGSVVLSAIERQLSEFDRVEVNLAGVKSMATFNAKQIFGALYLQLGADDFFRRIAIKDASQNVASIIRVGIVDALREPAHA